MARMRLRKRHAVNNIIEASCHHETTYLQMPQNLLLARKSLLTIPVTSVPKTVILALARADMVTRQMRRQLVTQRERPAAARPAAHMRGLRAVVVLLVDAGAGCGSGAGAWRGREAGRGLGRRDLRARA